MSSGVRAAWRLALGALALATLGASEPRAGVETAPSNAGRVGAWLVVGPFRSATFDLKKKPSTSDALTLPPEGLDESTLASPKLGALVTSRRKVAAWTIASASEGSVDVVAALHPGEGDVVAYAAGTLHVAKAGRHYFLVGADDGARLSIDGKPVLTRDEARPQRDDDDVIPVDLAEGDHAILLKLHQRDGAWRFSMRVLDESLSPPPGAYVTLPGTTDDDARALAAKASWVSLDRGISPDGYRPKLTVKFLQGAPRGVPLRVHAKLYKAVRGASADPVFDVDAGAVGIDDAGVGETVVSLPEIVGEDVARIEDADLTYEIDVAGRKLFLPFYARKYLRSAIAHADRALAPLESASAPPAWIHDGTIESVRHLRDRLARLVDHGDADGDAQQVEARELEEAASALDRGVDPYERRTGPMRRAYRSPVDGELAEFALYVPPGYKPDRKRRYPLVVALHGLNGKPMTMLRHFFGGDSKDHDTDWEDRHWDDALPPLDAFVVAPAAHGNAMYRELGEDDVMRVLAWVEAAYPIDRDHVTITGPSMGGIGTAAVAFRHPDVFCAAAPLCGYHSYFVRRDTMGRPMRPWERTLAEERSNSEWAPNGQYLPLWIVHGTQDKPEANSGVLIDAYEKLGFSVKHDHPNLGHNVWQPTYENLVGAKWLLSHARVAHPRVVDFRTIRLRDGDDAWVHVTELGAPDKWGNVHAEVESRSQILVNTRGVSGIRLDRDETLVDATTSTTRVSVDGARFTFTPSEPIALHKEGAIWMRGDATHQGLWKRGEITGPIRDAFHAPLFFVYGADDKTQTRANEEVARAWAKVRYGVTVEYPVMSDAEFFARGEPLANDKALFLVGNAKSNRVVRALEGDFPIRAEEGAIVIGPDRVTGAEVGAAFVRPNPKRPDRYVVVVEGADATGTWRSLSLPDLIPDFVVYDARVAPARGQVLLGAAMVRAAGFFDNDWALPERRDDPLAKVARPGTKSEYDATPYLP